MQPGQGATQAALIQLQPAGAVQFPKLAVQAFQITAVVLQGMGRKLPFRRQIAQEIRQQTGILLIHFSTPLGG